MTTRTKVRHDRRPLYLQAEEVLAEVIAGYESSDQLPSEPELAQRLGISRATLREAMRAFEKRGLIERRTGVGTFVVAPHPVIESGLEQLESIDTLAGRLGLKTKMAGLEIEARRANAQDAARLEIDEGASVIAVSRVILTSRQPIAFLRDVVPESVLTRDALKEFPGSVLDILLRRGEPELGYSRTELTAALANTRLARCLHIKRGRPLMALEAVLFTREGEPVDYSHSYFVPGYFKFHVVRRVGNGATFGKPGE